MKHSSKKDSYAVYERHPERDWVILIAFMTVLTIIVAASSIYFYNGISSGTFFTGSTAPTNLGAILDTNQLNTLDASYAARATEFSALQSNDPKVFDPSL